MIAVLVEVDFHLASAFIATFCSHEIAWSSSEWSRNKSGLSV